MNKNQLLKTPLLLGAIALSPALFITNSLEVSLIYGIIFVMALMVTALLSRLVQKFVSTRLQLVTYIILILLEVTIFELLIDAYLPLLLQKAGIYVSLILVNLVFIRFDQEEKINYLETLKLGGIFLLGLILVGFTREFLGTFNIAYGNVLPITAGQIFDHGNSSYALKLLIEPAGGFIAIGFLLGLLSIFKKEDNNHA